jgi:hypothetical protein
LLLNRPVLFFAVVTLALGLLGGLGLIGSRYGPQLVPAGAIGFAYGLSLGSSSGLRSFYYGGPPSPDGRPRWPGLWVRR